MPSQLLFLVCPSVICLLVFSSILAVPQNHWQLDQVSQTQLSVKERLDQWVALDDVFLGFTWTHFCNAHLSPCAADLLAFTGLINRDHHCYGGFLLSQPTSNAARAGVFTAFVAVVDIQSYLSRVPFPCLKILEIVLVNCSKRI